MLRLTAERRETLGRESGALASHKTPSAATADKAVSHSSPNGANINVGASRTRPRPLRTTLICVAGLLVLSAGILAAGPIAGHLPDIILGLCIVILGMLFGVLLAVRS